MAQKILIRAIKPSVLDDPNAIAKESNLKLRCGDCIHYTGSAHPSYGEPCQNLGIRTASVAPNCYTPNVSLLRDLGTDSFGVLAGMLGAATPQQTRIIAGLFRAAGTLERQKLHFLQAVYFHIGGTDPSLDNCYKGYVLGVGLDKQIQVIGGDYMRMSRAACVASLDRSSLMTFKQFKALKDKLIAKGKIKSLPPKVQIAILDDGYEPPTFETSPEALEAKANKTHKRRKADKEETPVKGKPKRSNTLFSIDSRNL